MRLTISTSKVIHVPYHRYKRLRYIFLSTRDITMLQFGKQHLLTPTP